MALIVGLISTGRKRYSSSGLLVDDICDGNMAERLPAPRRDRDEKVDEDALTTG